MTQEKKFQELDLNDAFLFAAALEDPETCRLVLELILGMPIGPVRVRTERSILFSKNFRYVRFDVYARDEVDVSYNMEMQKSHKAELPKRSRYHQAEMDVAELKPGENFNQLPPSYIIFICTYDPFSSGLYRYVFEERCAETGEALGDGAKRIFLNTRGTNDQEVPQELIQFLKYVENSTEEVAEGSGNEKIQTLHQKVTALKRSRELEEKYMTMEELLEERETEGRKAGVAEGRKAGVAEGQDVILQLVSLMSDDGLAAEIPRLKADKDFLSAMLEKYCLK